MATTACGSTTTNSESTDGTGGGTNGHGGSSAPDEETSTSSGSPNVSGTTLGASSSTTGATGAIGTGTGGFPGTGGAGTRGVSSTGGAGAGGSAGKGGTGNGGSGAIDGAAGAGGLVATEGPCDVYEQAGTPCVAAYSTVRRLSSQYTGPLYQVRSGSSAENTGSGGQLHDIGTTDDGFGDAEAQDAVCANTVCTISLLYDQSGNGNHLPVAKAGLAVGGDHAAEDDFESIADAGPLTVDGRDVYSLYTAPRQGYRLPDEGTNLPEGNEPQGIYMLADGTHHGTACCFDFGNAPPDPQTFFLSNTLFFGVGSWGKGAGDGPWFMADFEAGVWAGGSHPGDPGWGAIDSPGPVNPSNPSLPVVFALGFLKTNPTTWALRMADAVTETAVTTAFEGALPKIIDNPGGVILGVGRNNENDSWGTFYEGAIVAGYPSDAAELAVLRNVQAAGYGR